VYLYSVVVHYLYLFSACRRPAKTDTPLIVDANTVLTSSIAFQGFQPVSRRHPQVIQSGRDFDLPELPPRYVSDISEAFDAVAPGERLGLGAPERLDHAE
jgi:hypothetical protein